jgi:hypothetical protein
MPRCEPQGLKYREIAAELGISMPSVSRILAGESCLEPELEPVTYRTIGKRFSPALGILQHEVSQS